MQKTLVVVTTHRGLSDETYESILSLGALPVLKSRGSANIDIARSRSFDQAVAFLRSPVGQDFDTLLLVDDDMLFGPREAQTLVDESRAANHPVSARYATAGGKVCAMSCGTSLYFTGLGFMAIPRAVFLDVADRLPKLGGVRRWCWTGELLPEFPDSWSGEDVIFCSHFSNERGHRGVRLSGVQVGHLKTLPLKPAAAAPLIVEAKSIPWQGGAR